jgi:uncharacterized damage-inducible protein DinB
MTTNVPEVWLRGSVEGIPALLQPVAHALMQSVEEVQKMLQDFPPAHLWERPAGVASVGFHLQHIPGVLDRLSTYALGKPLSAEQMSYLQREEKETAVTTGELVTQLEKSVQRFIEQLKHTDPATLTEYRGVGRKALPSTVMGLLFHAAEHTMRHTGQLLVTAKLVQHKE